MHKGPAPKDTPLGLAHWPRKLKQVIWTIAGFRILAEKTELDFGLTVGKPISTSEKTNAYLGRTLTEIVLSDDGGTCPT